MKKQRVLILSASVGAGHLRAAAALEHAFQEIGEEHEVRHLDTLDYATTTLRAVYSKAYSYAARRLPLITGWLYHAFDQPWRPSPLHQAFVRLNTKRFVVMLRDYKPDIAVCTHFLPAEILSGLAESDTLAIPYFVVITDFEVHAMWLSRHCEQYFVATDESRAHLESLGISNDRITVTGIPIDPVFSAPRSSVKFKIVGFVNDMDQLMSASDVLVGRPGGLLTAEALASGLLFVIVSPIPGQEERNADYLLEENAAIRCNDPTLLAYKIERLLSDQSRSEFMKKNVARIARPRAAFNVVDTLLRLANARGISAPDAY